MRRLSTMRKRSKSRSVPKCKNVTPLDIERLLANVHWKISDTVNMARMSFQHNLKTIVCSGSISLLLPAMIQNGGGSKQNMSVYFMESIRKSKISVHDILKVVYHFYNTRKILAEDITYISVSHPYTASQILQNHYLDKNFLNGMRFVDFMDNHIHFAGLYHQGNNVFVLRLRS